MNILSHCTTCEEQHLIYSIFLPKNNSVFSQLQHALCKTGDSPKKAELANVFSVKVVQIDNKKKYKVMQKQLEGSFDLRAGIEEIAKKAPVDEATV